MDASMAMSTASTPPRLRRLRRKATRVLLAAAFGVCFLLAMGIELGQIVQPSHTPDFSDVMLCTIGASAGMLVATRVWRGNR